MSSGFRVRFKAQFGPTVICLASSSVLASGVRADELEGPKYKTCLVFKEERKCRALRFGHCMCHACVR